MIAQTSPLVGYNTNIRHKGKLYHIQTEDSGIRRPHIITHLFTDGGRIVASARTDYAEHVGSDSLPTLVKAKMQEQHKAMLLALRDGRYDEGDQAGSKPAQEPKTAVAGQRAQPSRPNAAPRVQPDALDAAADSKLAGSPALAERQRRGKRASASAEDAGARQTAGDDEKVKRAKSSASKNRRKEASESHTIERFIDERALDRVVQEYRAQPSARQRASGGRSSGR